MKNALILLTSLLLLVLPVFGQNYSTVPAAYYGNATTGVSAQYGYAQFGAPGVDWYTFQVSLDSADAVYFSLPLSQLITESFVNYGAVFIEFGTERGSATDSIKVGLKYGFAQSLATSVTPVHWAERLLDKNLYWYAGEITDGYDLANSPYRASKFIVFLLEGYTGLSTGQTLTLKVSLRRE